jgi:pimeloyl-ACP methyl ester carboxylesterase
MTISNNFFFRRITSPLRMAASLILAGCAFLPGPQPQVNQPKTAPGASVADDGSQSSSKRPKGCDMEPTGVHTSDYWLDFRLPRGLMPDPQFVGKLARIEVHRVRPVYAHGKCHGVPNRAIVLIHGRSIPGPVAFDLRHKDSEGRMISLQESLARAGIDTFAPSLLGYGRSTRFDKGLNDPCNASFQAYNKETCLCESAGGCDHSSNQTIFPLDQQEQALRVNPLAGRKCKHSSGYRFARIDVWARDVKQVINDAIARARPDNNKVVLVGSSLGGVTTARFLYRLGDEAPSKVQRVVFIASFFNRLFGPTGAEAPVSLPTEENKLSVTALSTSFPMALFAKSGGELAPEDDSGCPGRVITGLNDALWEQLMKRDVLGRKWGGSVPMNPDGRLRAPTFSNYGWNPEVAGKLKIPTLILHGLDDKTIPPSNAKNIFDALPSVNNNKVLVQVKCASHAILWDGCTDPTSSARRRCDDGDPNTKPYGGSSQIWAGPYSTVSAALIEWVRHGTFNGAENGRFVINESGIVGALR